MFRLMILCLLLTCLPLPARAAVRNVKSTEHDVRRQLLDFNRRTTVEAYKQVGSTNPKWDADAIAFLDACAGAFSLWNVEWWYRPTEVPNLQQRAALGQKAVDAGCDDAMVLDMLGLVYVDLGNKPLAKKYLVEAGPRVQASKYAGFRKFFSARRWLNHLDPKDPAIAQAQAAVQKTSIEALSDGTFTPGDRNALYSSLNSIWMDLGTLRDKEQGDLAQQKIDTLMKIENADPWFVQTLAGSWRSRSPGPSAGAGGRVT